MEDVVQVILCGPSGQVAESHIHMRSSATDSLRAILLEALEAVFLLVGHLMSPERVFGFRSIEISLNPFELANSTLSFRQVYFRCFMALSIILP